MINVSTIMDQFMEHLSDDPLLTGFRISRGEPVNEDAGQAHNGWIGLYRRSVTYEPRNLGVPPNNYEGDLVFSIIVQKTDLRSGQNAEDALEGAVKLILDRIVQVPRTYVDTFTDASVEYTYLESDRTTMYFQAALITLTARFSIEVE
jgi:hypothetical protein